MNFTTNRYTLDQAEKLRTSSPQAIEQHQFTLLQQHLQHALNIPFYKRFWQENGIDITMLTSLQDIQNIPLTTRKHLDQFADQFGLQDRSVFSDYALTSGTTGDPVVVPYTESDLARLAFSEAAAFHGVGVKKEDTVLLTVTLDRCFIAGLAYYSGVVLLGAAAIRSGAGQPARQLHIIQKLKPEVIVGVPTFLKALGLWAKENGLSPQDLPVHSLVTVGEPIRKADHVLTKLGQELEDLWGAKLYSSYGATEVECAFCECNEFQGGHVHPELMIAEIIDDEGNVLPDGEPGEVVVTPLGVQGFPLVRLRTGDIARLHSSPCECGWNTKRLGAVEGRLAQRLKYKGTTFYPETIFHVLQDLITMDCAYVEVRSTAEGADDVTVVVGSDNLSVNVDQIENQLQAHLRVKPALLLKKTEEVQAVMMQHGGRKPQKFFDYRAH